eukprot:8877143-Ditylum_brightwellii.AAC.1
MDRSKTRLQVTMLFGSWTNPSLTTDVRPYTFRQGDSVAQVTRKRGLSVDEVKRLNPQIDLEHVSEGQTILLPSR